VPRQLLAVNALVPIRRELGSGTTKSYHSAQRWNWIENVTFATGRSVVKTPSCQPSPKNDASALELICHRSSAFVRSTRACHPNTAQRSTCHRTVCILPPKQITTYWEWASTLRPTSNPIAHWTLHLWVPSCALTNWKLTDGESQSTWFRRHRLEPT